MKITLPEHIGDITLDQYQKFYKLNQRELSEQAYNKRKIAIFTELKYKDIDNIKQSDYEGILAQIDIAINIDGEFKQRFKIGKQEFGLIPNFDKMTTKEYVDLQEFEGSEDDLHKVMAILYRPVNGKDYLGNYTIESYNGIERWEGVMKRTPMSIVNGALGFFLTISKDLQRSIQRFTVEALLKANQQYPISKNGDGSQPLVN